MFTLVRDSGAHHGAVGIEDSREAKERATPVWCLECRRRPTWSSSSICLRCAGKSPASGQAPARAIDRLEGFEVVNRWPAVGRFAAVVVTVQTVLGLFIVLGSARSAAAIGSSILAGLVPTVMISGAAATGVFLLALRFSEPFYLPMRSALNRAAYVAGGATGVLSMFVCCVPLLGLSSFAAAYGVVSGLASAFASGAVLEAAHKLAIKSIAQGEACLSCGHLLHGSTLPICPECGGPLLRDATRATTGVTPT